MIHLHQAVGDGIKVPQVVVLILGPREVFISDACVQSHPRMNVPAILQEAGKGKGVQAGLIGISLRLVKVERRRCKRVDDAIP